MNSKAEKMSWTTGDKVGLLLDLDERTLTYYFQGQKGKESTVGFIDLPADHHYHFYFSGAEMDEEVEIVEERLYLRDLNFLE